MIHVKRLNGVNFVINAELIEQIEGTPDTVITLLTGNNIVVRESVNEVIEKIIEYRKSIETKRSLKNQELISQKV